MAQYDYREPILAIVDNYFAKKQMYFANGGYSGSSAPVEGITLRGGEHQDDTLPETPCHIVRDDNGRAVRFIYGDIVSLDSDEDGDTVIWQEELIRRDTGQVVKVITTYPDGETVTTELVRGTDGKLTDYIYSQEAET